jgi:hypothetical protein
VIFRIAVTFGLYLILDGFGSMVVYHKQKAIEHVPRLIRAAIGIVVIVWL